MQYIRGEGRKDRRGYKAGSAPTPPHLDQLIVVLIGVSTVLSY